MEVGDKYILEIEEVEESADGGSYARVKGFDSLAFDEDVFLNFDKIDDSHLTNNIDNGLAYDDQYYQGMEKGWSLAQRVAETPIADLISMGINVGSSYDEYQGSCNAICNHTVDKISELVEEYDDKEASSRAIEVQEAELRTESIKRHINAIIDELGLSDDQETRNSLTNRMLDCCRSIPSNLAQA